MTVPAGKPTTGKPAADELTAEVTAEVTADAIAAEVRRVPGVVDLHTGRFGEVATYLPGRRVAGVKLGENDVEVHVVLAENAPIRPTAQRIHAAVGELVTLPVHVVVEDLAPAT